MPISTPCHAIPWSFWVFDWLFTMFVLFFDSVKAEFFALPEDPQTLHVQPADRPKRHYPGPGG